MFGIFMTAIPVGALSLFIIRKFNFKTIEGNTIEIPTKKHHGGIIIGSLTFGFGWALTGACPGPIYAQIGTGSLVTIATLAAALAGALSYEYLKKYLPE